jgi:Phage integrase family
MEGKGRDDLMFAGAKGAVLRVSTFRPRVFAPAVARCQAMDRDFPTVTPHDLRHTAASLAISAGANVKAVQTMLGHKSAAMTLDTYSDLFPDDLDAVAARLDEAVRAEGVGIVGRRCSGGWLATLHKPLTSGNVVELQGIEPWTSSMRTKRATNCATAPGRGLHREPSTTIAAGQRPCGHPAGPMAAAEKDHPIRKASPESTGTLRDTSISAATAISSP